MITGKPIKIVAMGTYLPKKVSSSEIEDRYGIPSGWSEKYSGVSNRHMVTTESNGFMGARAAEEVLSKANMGLDQIDMLLSAGGTFDYPLPNQASIIKHELKDGALYDFPAIDIDSTCLSFVASLDFASRLLDGKSLKTILIVSAEISSKGLNTKNWETTTLFGDGAAAAIVQYDEESKSLFIRGIQKTYSVGTYHTWIQGGGNQYFFKDNPYDEKLHSFKMDGKKLLRLAKEKIPLFVEDLFRDLDINIEEVDVIVPHQASKFGMKIFDSLYSFKKGQVKTSLALYGNCIAASIPLTLSDCIDSGEVKRGDLCLLIGTSAGFSIGGILFKY
ncbi:3-oxoacyl-ACP synthase [Crocinitomix catalasitica]|uniref:3-oxoacyl-ACP synthase n=1 Tax=Crocinitomix catalasitica TaxID=184607 RepID=UPI0004894574|nr:3-oxoacyl-ACP synthase [Crocinitomix catalasitica]